MFKPHDLLEIEEPEALRDFNQAPGWVGKSLAAAPFLVVRRKPAPPAEVAVGVRGLLREERWASFIHESKIKSVIAPFDLTTASFADVDRLLRFPALSALKELEREWQQLTLKWGPGGSVGFELASGFPCVTMSSDLDIVLFAPEPFTREFATNLLMSSREISQSIDVIVEAPHVAFSLQEFAICDAAPILLRSSSETQFGLDPWNPPRSADGSSTCRESITPA